MFESKFIIKVDGIKKEAELIKNIELFNKKYAIYSVEKDNLTSDIFASEIVKNDLGEDILIDIEDEKIKNKIAEIVNTIFS